MGKAVALAGIAPDTRAHDIFPSGLSATVPGKNVVKVEQFTGERLAAVLAGVFITLEHIVPGELDLLFREAIEKHEHDDPWKAYVHRDCIHHFPAIRILTGKVLPTRKVMGHEALSGICGDDLGVPLVEKGEGSPGAAGVDRLPEPVED